LIQRRQPPVVVFPAVRYLVDTTREHQRRLKLHNWLLLLIRTLLIALLVLAAAGPTAPIKSAVGHSPAAMVLILDNSLSSGAVVNGTSRLATFKMAAREILDRATPEDHLWLMLGDGVLRGGDPGALRLLVDSATPSFTRLDLGQALAQAQEVLTTQRLPGEMVLITDLQRTAVTQVSVRVPLLTIRPEDDPSGNLGVAGIDAGPQPWSQGGGRALVSVVGDSNLSLPLTVRLGERPPRQALASAGAAIPVTLNTTLAGWWPVEAELDPDELLADNRRTGVVRVAPVARVSWDSTERFIAAACQVLERNGRISRGNEVAIGRITPGLTIVEPPEDPAQVGAVNRALAARGVGWQYGTLVAAPATSDSNALVDRERVARRYTLETTESGRTGVIATVGGAPWIVRTGSAVVLGSRLDPEWTGLPLSANFVPFMDALLNRIARGELTLSGGNPNEPIALPDLVTAVRQGARQWVVEGGAPFRPSDAGIYFLLAGRDTIGALAVNFDPRESVLARASDGSVRDLWRGASFASPAAGPKQAFSLGVRTDLRGPALWIALVLGLAEVGVASARRKAS
ncbi:MAG: VWA domain-containing protein, partial [Gemmatimonadota bacterium]